MATYEVIVYSQEAIGNDIYGQDGIIRRVIEGVLLFDALSHPIRAVWQQCSAHCWQITARKVLHCGSEGALICYHYKLAFRPCMDHIL